MSDIDKGELFNGPDGKPSLRRIFSAAFGIAGIVLFFISAFRVDVLSITTWVQVVALVAPGAVCVITSLFIIQIFTAQMVADIVNKKKE